jgi:D-sedoheptulose 7-phosphate isomerase
LIRHHNDSNIETVQLRDRFGNSREKVDVALRTDVMPFRHLFVNDAVAIEKDRVDSVLWSRAFQTGEHIRYHINWLGVSRPEQVIMSAIDPKLVFESAMTKHLEVVQALMSQQNVLEAIALAMASTLHSGGRILWCGNGGSAADSQHLAAEIVGRFRRDRCGLSSIALTTDSSVLTAVANDYGYECVFSRQVEAIAKSGDLLVGISTSGNSKNVLMAMERARAMGLTTVAFTGAGGGKAREIADHLLAVSSNDTARIQEAHILAGHMLCDWLELDWIDSVREKAAGDV